MSTDNTNNHGRGAKRRGARAKPTIRDIARIAGVSETAVSLAFQVGSRIGETTRSSVLRIARELNYVPHLAARKLRSGRTGTVGIIVNDITNPFYGLMIRLAEHVVNSRGYQLVSSELEWDPRKEDAVARNMIQNRVEAVIFCSTEKNPGVAHAFDEAGLPHVMVDTCPADYTGSYVINDAFAVGYEATTHLIEIGCRRLAMFDADDQMKGFSSFQLMRKGFLAAIEEFADESLTHVQVSAGLSIDAGRTALQRCITRRQVPDGVFAVNDLCCLGIMDAADQEGISMGRDLAVVGIDNIEISEVQRISLSSVAIDYPTMLEEASSLLIDAVETGVMPDARLMVSPRLIKRSSTLSFARRNL